MNVLTYSLIALSLFAGCAGSVTANSATTAAGHNQLRIQTSLPKKAGDSLFSYTVEWRQDGGKLYHSTGMSFLDALKQEQSDDAANRIAKKLANAIKESMIQLDPNWRGLEIQQPDNQSAFILSNKSGYALTTAVVRDYTNQTLSFDLLGKRFNTESVQIAFDIVLAADVEYLDKFSAQKSKTAAHGDIQISIDGQTPLHIKTDGKTTRDIETEISRQLAGSKVSDTTLVSSQIGKDTRNIKPFDGSEVQLPNLAAKTVSVDITDPSVGILVKFKFKDNGSASPETSHYWLILLASLVVVAVTYLRLRKK